MGFINVAERTINAKLVYYGVGVGGKTTSLQRVHGILCPRNEVQLVSINTEEDSTLLFDFLPINLGSVGGFKIRIQGFTVPGQPKYKQMRKYVLAGADAVVFVVDSQRSRLQENLESLQSMRENLAMAAAAGIPVVMQYNKRDLDDILSEKELDQHFRFRDDIEAFPSVATEGQGVFEAFVHAAGMLVESKVRQYRLGGDATSPEDVADGARARLWEVCDQVRRERAEVPADEQPRTEVRIGESSIGQLPGNKSERETVAAGVEVPDTGMETELDLDASPADPNEQAEEVSALEASDQAVLCDEELERDLDAELGEALATVAEQSLEGLDVNSLLDSTVQSNLELVVRFGQLEEQLTRLEHKLKELVEIAQNTVHDLKRPVSVLRLMMSTLQKGYCGELPERAGDAVQNGMLALQQMDLLIRDLLDSSRLDHDGITLDFQQIDPTLLFAQVVNTLRFEVEERDAQVRIEPMTNVCADEWALTKAASNLVGNALQYADPNRRLVIRIWMDEEGDEWRLFVRDNGIGIPEKDRRRLFRRFERGSNTSGISGSGLGLHIVKEILAGHGGHVTFESHLGVGTTFCLHLPKQPFQPEHSPVSDVPEQQLLED